MRASLRLLGQSSSSKRWLARQFTDPYVKKRLGNNQNYRSRSAFKLLEMDSIYHFIPKVINKHGERMHVKPQVVVDLGAAPGGWSQVVAAKFGHRSPIHIQEMEEREETLFNAAKEEGFDPLQDPPDSQSGWGVNPVHLLKNQTYHKIIALDLLPLEPITGVETVQLSFLHPRAEELIAGLIPSPDLNFKPHGARNPVESEILGCVKPQVDLILSDMAPNISGSRIRDIAATMDLCYMVLDFACKYLKRRQEGRGHGMTLGGNLVIKYFASPEADKFRSERLTRTFRKVYSVKPDSSRGESSEFYWICKDFRLPSPIGPYQ